MTNDTEVRFVDGKLRIAMLMPTFALTPENYALLTAGFLTVDSNARSGELPRPDAFLRHRVVPSPLNPYQPTLVRDLGTWSDDMRFPWRFPWQTETEAGVLAPTLRIEGPVYFGYLDEDFERLAKTDPAALAALLVSGDVPPARLTFAAEIAGRALPGDMVIDPLLTLLGHERAVVREGAVYGIARFLSEPRVRKALEALLLDPSPGVRAAVADELDAYDDTTLS